MIRKKHELKVEGDSKEKGIALVCHIYYIDLSYLIILNV